MKRTILLTSLLVLIVFMLGACTYSGVPVEDDPDEDIDECTSLENSFDQHIDTMDMQKCKEYENKELMVGATLTSIETIYNEGHDRHEHTLVFEGSEKEGSITIHTFENETIPYKEGVFYTFDLTGNCPLMNSAASSGAFNDPELDALEALEECN